MTHTISAAELRIGDRYLSTANAGRAVTVKEAMPFDVGRVILFVTDDDGMTYRTILRAERELEVAEHVETETPAVVFDGLQWATLDGLGVCQDHAEPLPCLFCSLT